MTDSNPQPQVAPPLELPPALLYARPEPPHPDSEEFRQDDRFRTAEELQPLDEPPATDIIDHYPTYDAPRSERCSGFRSRGNSFRITPTQTASHGYSDISTALDEEGEIYARRFRLRRQVPHWYDPIVKFWNTHISLTIDEGSHRDHLALERTFLGYLRTSVALSMTGVLVAQLFRLQHTTNPNLNIGFYVMGIPLASLFICLAILVLLIGAFRFWRQQGAMVRGKIFAGGWEIKGIMVLSILLCLAVFALAVVIDIEKEKEYK